MFEASHGIGSPLRDDMAAVHIAQHDKDKETLTGMGMNVYDLPDSERDKWVAAVKAHVDEKLASLGDIGARLRSIADKANSENP